jgi:hypothetical protein
MENNYCLFSRISEERMRELFQLQPGGSREKEEIECRVGGWKQISDNETL